MNTYRIPDLFIKYNLKACSITKLQTTNKNLPTVAVLDTGTNLNDIQTIDIGLGTKDYEEHGTIITSIIKEYNTNIISIKIFDDNGICTAKYLTKALKTVSKIDLIKIINLSAGSVNPDPIVSYYIIKLLNQKKFVIAAAGNEGKTVNYPAAHNYVISVAAGNPNNLTLAPYSNFGKIDCITNDSYELNNKLYTGTSISTAYASSFISQFIEYEDDWHNLRKKIAEHCININDSIVNSFYGYGWLFKDKKRIINDDDKIYLQKDSILFRINKIFWRR